MAEAITVFAKDAVAALALGRQGRAMVAERFARARIEERLHTLYSTVASQRPSGSGPSDRLVAARTVG
jgi:hypothetical protein